MAYIPNLKCLVMPKFTLRAQYCIMQLFFDRKNRIKKIVLEGIIREKVVKALLSHDLIKL